MGIEPLLQDAFQSPLARRPGLAFRRLLEKAGLYSDRLAPPAPPVERVEYPPHWAPGLRQWVGRLPFHREPYPAHRVFGQDFDEATLLEGCRQGLRPDASGLGRDLKLLWDYSRGYALVLHAAAGNGTPAGDAAFVRRWLEANQDTGGVAWTCAMEVALRAVNWIAADLLHGEELGRALGPREWAAWLWRHGWLTWRRLEARRISSNHYLADLLGLVVVGSVFPGDPSARRWAAFARREMPAALLAQTRSDGGLREASLPYHAFVTEMALLFRWAAGAPFPPAAEERLHAMCRVVAEFQSATGDVFVHGDEDDGRVLALDRGGPSGRVEVLLSLATLLLQRRFEPSGQALFPDSGWWVCRAHEWVLAYEFGGVGLHGVGGHAHNDDLSFSLEWRGRPVVVDPGTASYTGDLAMRNRFRSTLAHNTVVLDGAEQRPVPANPFALAGPDQALSACAAGPNGLSVSRTLPAGVTHTRTVQLGEGWASVRDALAGAGSHALEWRFHLHPAVTAGPIAGGLGLRVPGAGQVQLRSSGATLPMRIEPAEYSPGYGRVEGGRVCIATTTLSLPATVEWTFQKA